MSSGREFVKMSGSGNDFIMVDARLQPPGDLANPATITALCARGTGVGADGIVFIEHSDVATVKLTYLNADGSLADLCGNATLCTTRLSVELGAANKAALTIETGAGIITARMESDRPEIDLPPVSVVVPVPPAITREAGEKHLGFALAGVPHLTLVMDDVATANVVSRGRILRNHGSLNHGANVNFVSKSSGDVWAIRTYERGVEAETLACGTGAVASAILLSVWQLADSPVSLRTRSGRTLGVRTERRDDRWHPSLSGSADIVFVGRLP